jgi:hypothetical protein
VHIIVCVHRGIVTNMKVIKNGFRAAVNWGLDWCRKEDFDPHSHECSIWHNGEEVFNLSRYYEDLLEAKIVSNKQGYHVAAPAGYKLFGTKDVYEDESKARQDLDKLRSSIGILLTR